MVGPAPDPNTAPLQAAYDVIVVGAGLAGLFAGALAARRGARALVIGRGLGGTHLGTGCIDVWGYEPPAESAPGRIVDDPLDAMQRLAGEEHPLRLAGAEAVRAALDELKTICAEAGYSLVGDAARNHLLPTAAGAERPTCLAPRSFTAGDLRQPQPLALASLVGFRDFYARLAAANLNAQGRSTRVINLELPRMPLRRDAFATDLARLFDEAPYRAEVARLWRPKLAGVERLGLPAIVGYLEPEAHAGFEEQLGLPVFEIPTLPPSVPGMRLFNALRRAVESAGGRVLVGPGVQGWVEAGRAAGIVAHTAGGPRRYSAQHVILATGGFRHGGLHAPAMGQAVETVFSLPLANPGEWYAARYWQAHPYARLGVRVDAAMRPLGEEGTPIFDNLYAAGGVLAGADRRLEGSREGIDLATAWKAVAQLAPAAAEARTA